MHCLTCSVGWTPECLTAVCDAYWKLKYFVVNIRILITRVINNIFLWNLAILSQIYSLSSKRNWLGCVQIWHFYLTLSRVIVFSWTQCRIRNHRPTKQVACINEKNMKKWYNKLVTCDSIPKVLRVKLTLSFLIHVEHRVTFILCL